MNTENRFLFFKIPEQDSHIFNHKGGLQIPNNINNNLAQQYITNNGYNAVPQSETYMQSMPEIYRIPQWSPDTRLPQTWPQQQQQAQMPMLVQPIQQQQPLQPIQQDILESQIREQQQQQRQNWPVRPAVNPPPTVDNHPINNPNKLPKSKVQTSDAQDSSEDSEYDEDDKTVQQVTEPPPKKKQRKHKDSRAKVNKDKAKKHDEQQHDHDKPMHEQLKMIKTDLDMEFMDHDGAADRPGGAVLSLTLGD